MIGQDPGPGSELQRGDRVTIIVSTGAGSVIVPDVVGQSEDAARAQPAEPRALRSTWSSRRPRTAATTAACSSRRRRRRAVRSGDQVTIVVGVFVEPEPTTTTTTTTDVDHDHDDHDDA